MSDAFLAGYHPKKTPIPIEIKKDSKIEAIETWTKIVTIPSMLKSPNSIETLKQMVIIISIQLMVVI